MRRLSAEEARRIAVRAQLLDAERPRDLESLLDRLTLLQLDPTAAIAPSADLVAWSRLGDAYQPAQLVIAQERDRAVFERHSQPTPKEPLLALIRPMADLRLFLADMAAYPRPGSDMDSWLRANERFRIRVLDQLRDSGPLASREIPDTSEVPWVSSGWRNARNVNEMLEALGLKGEVAVSARRGRERIWDLAERVYPPNTPVVPREEAHAIRNERWLKALGVARPKIVGEAGIAAEIEGTKGAWRLDPDATAEGFEGRTALLSPFDRLTHDRVRAMDLFGFEFLLEIYKPRDKRRWGFYALPILHGDAMVGKVDATADRAAGVLRVDAVHEDVPFTPAIRGVVDAELDALARWLGLEVRRTR